jgi:hypothetical protein
MDVTCHVADAIGNGWLAIPPTRIGSTSQTLRTPDKYVLVERSGRKLRRVDVYFHEGEYHPHVKSIHWRKWIAIGFGNRAWMVSVENDKALGIELSGTDGSPRNYFSDFRAEPRFLLVVGLTGLICLDEEGNLVWRSHQLGIDGVWVDRVADLSVEGHGDWDPPGSVRPFCISLSNGRPVSQNSP